MITNLYLLQTLTLLLLSSLFPNHVKAGNCQSISGAITNTFLHCSSCIFTGCTICEPGYGLYDGGCSLCASGQYASGWALTCATCPAGTYSTSGSGSCSICAAGTYSVGASASCTPCPAGQYSASQASSCIPCPGGTFSATQGGTSLSSCLSCPTGQFSSPGSSSCTACGSGLYSNSNSAACTKCAAGQYSAGGTGSCISCPAGKFSSEGASICNDCSAGSYSNEGDSICSVCPGGQYSGIGAASCSLCLAGEYSSAGASFCSTCLAGEYSEAGATACSICPAGSFSNSGAASCILCPGGTYSASPGAPSSVSCLACPAGYYSKEGAKTCLMCSAGQYSLAGASKCEVCSENESSDPGASSCFRTGNSFVMNISGIILSVVSKIGSAICIGSSLFAITQLMTKAVQNVRYMDIVVSPALQNAFQTWNTDFLSWNAPERVVSLPRSQELPNEFAQYEIDSRFLINYWSNLMMTLVAIFCFLMLKWLRFALKEELAQKKVLNAFVDYLILAASNYAIVQIYGSLDDILFYSVLDLRSTDFSFPILAISSILAIIIFVIAGGILVLHFWLTYRYIMLKRNSATKVFGRFTKKFEFLQVLFDDFKDKTFFRQSFFALLLIRAMISSLIIVTLYTTPLLQAITLIIINLTISLFLILKRPFKELYNEFVQYFYELLVFVTYLCVLVLAILDERRENLYWREDLSKCIIILNAIMYVGSLAFMCIEIYETTAEIHEVWLSYKNQKKVYSLSSPTIAPLESEAAVELFDNNSTRFKLDENGSGSADLLETVPRLRRNNTLQKRGQVSPEMLSKNEALDSANSGELATQQNSEGSSRMRRNDENLRLELYPRRTRIKILQNR